MRILVVGAGAIGGYFGGRLLEAGRDVTFLVRRRRAEQLARNGLAIKSPHGDVDLRAPTIAAEQLREPFDLILLSCKSYDLADAMQSFAPAVGPDTAILPVLNGMRHLDILDARFGPRAVLGGQCVISGTLDAEGRILHLNDAHLLSFGQRDGSDGARLKTIASALAGAKFEARPSDAILQEMWEKWVMIATGAGITCLMRGSVGDVVAAGAADLTTALLDECTAIASAHGFAPRQAALQGGRAMLTTAGSGFMASMLRDIERNAPTEADHVVGDLLRRGGDQQNPRALLRIAYAHLAAYEARRARTAAAGTSAPPR